MDGSPAERPDPVPSADANSHAPDEAVQASTDQPDVTVLPGDPTDQQTPKDESPFILYKSGNEFDSAVADLSMWVHGLLLPVYGREVSSMAPWCTRWWEHLEAVAQLYGLWMAWQELTGAGVQLTGPASWHRDFLMPVMNSLRDPSGPFAGCKPGQHRAKEPPPSGMP